MAYIKYTMNDIRTITGYTESRVAHITQKILKTADCPTAHLLPATYSGYDLAVILIIQRLSKFALTESTIRDATRLLYRLDSSLSSAIRCAPHLLFNLADGRYGFYTGYSGTLQGCILEVRKPGPTRKTRVIPARIGLAHEMTLSELIDRTTTYLTVNVGKILSKHPERVI